MSMSLSELHNTNMAPDIDQDDCPVLLHRSSAHNNYRLDLWSNKVTKENVLNQIEGRNKS